MSPVPGFCFVGVTVFYNYITGSRLTSKYNYTTILKYGGCSDDVTSDEN